MGTTPTSTQQQGTAQHISGAKLPTSPEGQISTNPAVQTLETECKALLKFFTAVEDFHKRQERESLIKEFHLQAIGRDRSELVTLLARAKDEDQGGKGALSYEVSSKLVRPRDLVYEYIGYFNALFSKDRPEIVPSQRVGLLHSLRSNLPKGSMSRQYDEITAEINRSLPPFER